MAKLDPRQKPLWANIDGTASGETLDGTNLQDFINGFGGDDTLNGLDGDDYLIGGTGNDTMNGGLGNDTMYVDAAGDIVNEAVGQGNDRVATEVSYTLAAGSEIERLDARNLTDVTSLTLVGNEFANTIIANNGVNILDGGAGADVMIGAGSDDTYYVDNAGDVVVEDVGGGVDRVATLVSYALSSGASVDIFEVLNQNSSNAIDLTGSNEANVIRGNLGTNFLYGMGGDDTIEANAGNDFLIGGTGDDRMLGGTGDDTYYVDSANDRVIDNVGEGNDRIASSSSYTVLSVSEVETLEAVNLTDTTAINLTGGTGTLLIIGNNGNNILTGLLSGSTIYGAGGNDTLSSSGIMYGGTGDDTYVTALGGGGQSFEYAGEGNDTVRVKGSYILAQGSSIELLQADDPNGTTSYSLTGNELSQSIVGNRGDNVIIGGGGEDDMTGGSGNDHYYVDSAGDVVHEAQGNGNNDLVSTSISYTLLAGQGVERLEAVNSTGTEAINLFGNDQPNTLTGNAGANILNGGDGRDFLNGLGGADTFQFTSLGGPVSYDTIVDFTSGSDKIALDDAVFTALTPGALSPNAFVNGTAAQDADDRIIYDTATGNLFYDADGNGAGAQVQFANLFGHPLLGVSDFVVI